MDEPESPPRWTAPVRRKVSLGIMGAALAVLTAGVVVWLLDGPGGALLALVLLALLLLVAQAAVLLTDASPERRAVEDLTFGEEAPVLEETLLTVRCGSCGTEFDVVETGVRPLRASCPGCGLPSVLGAPGTPAPREVARRLRARCGGCREVMTIEDTGARPLRHRCERCGRLNQLSPQGTTQQI